MDPSKAGLLNPNSEAAVFKIKGKLSCLEGMIIGEEFLEQAIHLQEQFSL